MNNDFKYLLELIDDENEQSASMAMAELLTKSSPELETMLCDLQESSNPRLRRRVHQLQSAIRSRRKRKQFADRLEVGSSTLLDGLIQLHLLWFDNDLAENVMKDWNALLDKVRDDRIGSLERLGFFMRKTGFGCPPRDTAEPDNYCFGAVIEDMIAADILLAAVTVLIGGSVCALKLKVAQINADFVVTDEHGNLLLPCADWKYVPSTLNEFPGTEWDVRMILRYVASMLFTAAAAGDGFRYLYTIGTCLAGNPADGLAFLPFPYSTKRRG